MPGSLSQIVPNIFFLQLECNDKFLLDKIAKKWDWTKVLLQVHILATFVQQSYIRQFTSARFESYPNLKRKRPLLDNDGSVVAGKVKTVYQLEFACSKSTMKTPEKCVKIC